MVSDCLSLFGEILGRLNSFGRRYHGVLAPNHRWRGLVTPAKRGKGAKPIANTEIRSPAERHEAMTWAQRLKRVFNMFQGTLS